MTGNQISVLAILGLVVGLFLWGRWRHDLVAVSALLACVLTGLVEPAQAFQGFGHPAVITVACMLIMSRALQTSGAVEVLARRALPDKAGPVLSLAALMGVGALLSGFMNNVGAMALLMPVGIKLAQRLKLPPGQVLMPLAFGTILGGMTTLIGTPPNLIVAGFRAGLDGGPGPFAMFDFAWIGVPVAVLGVLAIALVGWRLVPRRQPAGMEGFDTAAYLTEARLLEDGASVGKTLGEIEAVLEKSGAQVVGLVRHEMRITAPSLQRVMRAGDILVIEAAADSLSSVLSSLGLKLEESVRPPAREEEEGEGGGADPAEAAQAAATSADEGRDEGRDEGESDGERASDKPRGDAAEIALMEVVVLPGSALVGRSASDIGLRTRHGLNLLAVSRQGSRSIERLRAMSLRAGDILLLQGPTAAMTEFASEAGCVPLATRDLQIPNRRKAIQASLVMALAVGVAALGLVPAAVAFMGGVLATLVLRTLPLRMAYESIDWPVIVLLGALFPLANAMQSTGAADLMARALMDWVARGDPVIALATVLLVTMFLSDLMNNAATAAVMCPVAIGSAATLGVDADPFLMAVAIGASCAFLTPIGHQNNTMILGPGGLRFGDYWRLGVPLEALVVAVSLPLLLIVWPL
ncbi:MAG: SLC13 family permease [Hydrogenophaga sp.]|uniref:SLC13 family permease n=1 Tax=Hydrogenophaga sp. TaxID=1904254 RepID=UPI0016B65F4D|nr:SLC13 family permease [Hydrogenophaga sp.]NIM43387.1 SLC13 family permease [Hydrogenophaga sp.]NIN28456.1 SLC13 family permease [Hydrogenophaga sp.]NIN32915.1 SLC13 family permease [Hydrogenophaga sp.]NIN57590.1 SLC13 family permease [Hydrogenophaga sp.]NIO53885.1 SLC13 family permease [Hydrogenophaga sp.]